VAICGAVRPSAGGKIDQAAPPRTAPRCPTARTKNRACRSGERGHALAKVRGRSLSGTGQQLTTTDKQRKLLAIPLRSVLYWDYTTSRPRRKQNPRNFSQRNRHADNALRADPCDSARATGAGIGSRARAVQQGLSLGELISPPANPLGNGARASRRARVPPAAAGPTRRSDTGARPPPRDGPRTGCAAAPEGRTARRNRSAAEGVFPMGFVRGTTRASVAASGPRATGLAQATARRQSRVDVP